jgi:hypothetical protein
MFRVFQPRDTAEKYTPNKNDTLRDIAANHPSCTPDTITWQELAMFNWGTVDPREVNRGLIEILGCPLDGVDWANPEETKIDPAFAPDSGDKQLLIPKVWKKDGMAYEKTHTLKLKQRKPMPAVRITKLSKWFIPEAEKCDISYNLEGVPERADNLVWEIWASNYQTATLRAINPADSEQLDFTYAAADVPIRTENIADKKAPRPGADYAYNDWDGESKAADGVLKPRAGKKRRITVANSPYTVQYRFFKNAAHKDARIVLDAFWPRWTKPAGSPPVVDLDDASLKIGWEIKNCTVLKHGQLLVWDSADEADKPVFRKALGPNEVSQGKHDFTWAGGKQAITAARMPYRVQIQAHTGVDDDDGVALAAMHTEVRLYAPPELDTHADPVQDPQCFEIQLAPFFPDESVLVEGSRRWYQFKLACVGLHPGPVNGVNHDAYQIGLKEFQRTYPANAAAPYTRLTADGAEGAPTLAALKRVAAAVAKNPLAASPDRARPMFGDAAQLDSPGHEDMVPIADINGRLRDPAKQIVAWIEDRHYYTDVAPVALPVGDPLTMGNYRTGMSVGDGRVNLGANSTPRPWIPVEAAVPLLAKGDELTRNTTPALTDAMRRAAGPLRVDWMFTEIGEDLANIDATRYGPGRLRSRRFVREQIENLKTTHRGKDATNCPHALGGIRPTVTSPPGDPPEDYYKLAFGIEDFSLAPWKAKADASLRTVSVLMHDDLGQDAAKVHAKQTGKAGAYLNLSRIGGDGYQFRARVCFEKLGGDAGSYLYPNHEVLRDRYARLPQAHTCQIRNWRKTSFRAYLGWAPNANRRWGGPWPNQVARDYRSAFVHFAYEPGAQAESLVSNLFPAGAKRTALLNTMATNSHAAFPRSPDVRFQNESMWPWSHRKDMGVTFAANPGEAWSAYKGRIVNNSYLQWAYYLIVTLIKQVEQTRGLLRGHVLVEFRGSPPVTLQRFQCANGHQADNVVGALQAPGTVLRACPIPACGRNLRATNASAGPFDLVSTALGLALGGSFLISLTNNEDHPWWTHEMGHNRHLQHAAGEAGNQPRQHDSENNTSDVALQADGAIGAQWKRWDRVCTMSYTDSRQAGADGGDDRQQFCGKCLLKNRGWRVESLPALPGVLGGGDQGP